MPKAPTLTKPPNTHLHSHAYDVPLTANFIK